MAPKNPQKTKLSGKRSSRRALEGDSDERVVKRDIVFGVVTDGIRPAAKAQVRLLRRQLRSEQILETTVSDEQGRFELHLGKLAEGNLPANLYVEASVNGRNAQVAVSRTGRLNIAIQSLEPAFQRLRRSLAEVAGMDVEIGKQDHDEIAKLTGARKTDLQRFFRARGLAKACKGAGYELPEEVAFALGKHPRIQDRESLFARTPGALRSLLEQSIKRGEIGSLAPEAIDEVVREISEAAVRAIKTKRIVSDQIPMGDLVASVDEKYKGQIARLWFRTEQSADRFWKAVYHDRVLSADARKHLADAAAIGRIAGGDQKLAGVLRGVIKKPSDLARISADELAEHLMRASDLPAGNAKEIAASAISRARKGFPQVGLLSDIGASTGVALDALADKPDFDLASSAIKQHVEALNLDGAKKVQVLSELKAAQRVIRIVPTYSGARALQASGYHSATKIVTDGKAAFLEKVGQALGIEEAEYAFARARDIHARAVMMMMEYMPPKGHGASPAVSPTPVFDFDEFPDLKTLFDDQTLCACERCRSVLGEAAYLVDLLQFLRRPDNNQKRPTALAVLTGSRNNRLRRPDLVKIGLSCENTNTLIPYLDIVLEVLEHAVAGAGAVPAHQTTLTEVDIATQSEHVNPVAYERTASAAYPFTLPFDVQYAELQLILEQLKVSRLELMETFADLGRVADPSVEREFLTLTSAQVWQSEQVAGEVFKLNSAERKVMTGEPLRPGVMTLIQTLWGFPLPILGWVAELSRLDKFLKRSGLSYTETLQLLGLRTFSGARPIRLQSDKEDECDPAKMRLDGLDTHADRLQRFIRLYRRSGWSMVDLDRAVQALAARDGVEAPDINGPFLVRMSHVQRLLNRFPGATVGEVLSWWADLDTADYTSAHLPTSRSHYAEVFEKDRTIQLPLAEIQSGAHQLSDRSLVLRNCLRLEENDYSALIAYLRLDNAPLNLVNVSALYRYGSLSKRLGIGVLEMLRYLDLAGDPFRDSNGGFSSLRTLAFLERWDSFRRSGIPLADIRYFIGGLDQDSLNLAPSTERVLALSQALTGGLAVAETNALRESLVIQNCAEHFGVDAAVMESLLRSLLIREDGTPYLQGFLEESDATNPGFLAPYRCLHAFAWFHRHAGGVDAHEVGWMFRQAPAAGFSDPSRWPANLADTEARQREFNLWRRWEQWLELRKAVQPGQQAELVTLFALGSVVLPVAGAQAEREAYVGLLGRIFGWSAGEIQLLLGRFEAVAARVSSLNASFRHHFKDEQLPFRILQCMRLAAKAGLPLQVLSPDALLMRGATSRHDLSVIAARGVLRAKVGESAWQNISASIRDAMRERQRRALADYLVTQWGLSSTAELFDHFLLDVEMSACRKTTRIQAATNSVQLFIDRCLMNLEPEAVLTEEAEAQWQWMKRYSLWEANRKIFLYPENYLSQEFRDEKTPFFRELEDELKGMDITDANAEEAFRHYIEKVDSVARLQICGIYVEPGVSGDSPRVVHVFGRTRNSPHVYYYRRWLNGMQWTPWERVDVDIEGDHLIPVVYFGKVYLFWPVISEKDGGPFNIDAFLAPFASLLNLLAGLAQAGGSAGYAVVKTYNEIVKTIVDGINELAPGDEDVLDEDDFHIDLPNIFSDELDLPVVLELIADGMRLIFDTVVLYHDPVLKFIKLLPKKEYSIHMAWSEYQQGQWTAKKMSNTAVTYEDVTGPTIEQIEQLSEGQRKLYTFDRKRLFSFSARTSGNSLRIQAHGTRLGLSPGQDLDGTFLEFVGDFIFDDAHSSLLARQASEGDFDFIVDLFNQLQELALAISTTALQLVAGEPITQEDDPSSRLKSEVISKYLTLAPERYRVVGAHQYQSRYVAAQNGLQSLGLGSYVGEDERIEDQFFLQDSRRTFWFWDGMFEIHYHPYLSSLIRSLNRHGLQGAGLMSPSHQSLTEPDAFDQYNPTPAVEHPRPRFDIDYRPSGAYSIYNWELFIHAPLLIAEKLMANKRHEEAERWFHCVFDPTDRSNRPVPARYWRPKHFAQTSATQYHQEHIRQIMLDLAGSSEARQDLSDNVNRWRRDPFNPFGVARLRTTSFQRAVVFTYIRNLIAWGDQLFQQGTPASTMGALLLYRRAEQLLGPRPADVYARVEPPARTFEQLREDLDAFSNVLVEWEQGAGRWLDLRPRFRAQRAWQLAIGKPSKGTKEDPPAAGPRLDIDRGSLLDTGWFHHVVQGLYFCVPRNGELTALWDIVADRQAKIRNCKNIEGADFPPIDDASIPPELAMRARQQGLDLGVLLQQARAPLPHYRFTVMLQRAIDFTNDVKALGAALLNACEKRDAERLALLRQEQERILLDAVRHVKLLTIREAEKNLDSARRARSAAETRHKFYAGNLMFPVSGLEAAQLTLLGTSIGMQTISAALMGVASGLSLIPDVLTGFPIVAAETGGSYASNASDRAAKALSETASIISSVSSMVGIMAGFERRAQEWEHQRSLAKIEINQADLQIAAAEFRVSIANRDLENHDLSREHSRVNLEFLQTKFSNEELYDYMATELSQLHSEAYGLALELARQAEVAYRLERCEPLHAEPHLIQGGHWDSLRKGLMAGEWLHTSLKRMEARFLEQNVRRHEITKNISLRQFFPAGLVELKASGKCEVVLPEWLFDMDYPGHYQRQIKSIAISIPCVAGPYSSVNCSVRMDKNRVRLLPDLGAGFTPVGDDDYRFYSGYGRDEAIMTSRGVSDSGMFQLDLRDERLLPFEGAGVESSWTIELPAETNYFDVGTISDVILHMQYTSIQGPPELREAALANLRSTLPSSGDLLFEINREFPGEWQRARNGDLAFRLQGEHFPFYARGKHIQLTEVHLFAATEPDLGRMETSVVLPGGNRLSVQPLAPDARFGNLLHAQFQVNSADSALGEWSILVTQSANPVSVADHMRSLIVLLKYQCG